MAIKAALECNWTKAITVNSALLKDFPADLNCLNRLGKAHLETGNIKMATHFFRQVLKIDKYNPIAQKNLARATGTKNITKQPAKAKTPTAFLEEPGKTRLVTLVNVAPYSILFKQDIADSLSLAPKRHTVLVEDLNNHYIGALPDDLGHRLGILIKGGNRYQATIKSVSKNTVTIFLKEIYRAKKFHNTPSFLTNNAEYLTFVREEAAVNPSPTEDDDSADHHSDEEPETS